MVSSSRAEPKEPKYLETDQQLTRVRGLHFSRVVTVPVLLEDHPLYISRIAMPPYMSAFFGSTLLFSLSIGGNHARVRGGVARARGVASRGGSCHRGPGRRHVSRFGGLRLRFRQTGGEELYWDDRNDLGRSLRLDALIKLNCYLKPFLLHLAEQSC